SPHTPSCPGSSRASTSSSRRKQDVDGRDKPGHDDAGDTLSLSAIVTRSGGRSSRNRVAVRLKILLPGDRIELLQPLLHRLTEVITALAERGVALLVEITLLPGQRQRRAMAVGFRARDHPQKHVVDVAVELG